MEKTIWVDWQNEFIYTDREEWVANYVADNTDDTDRFSEWLNDKYTAYDLWRMNGSECEDILDDWKDYLAREAEEEFDYNFEEVVITFNED